MRTNDRGAYIPFDEEKEEQIPSVNDSSESSEESELDEVDWKQKLKAKNSDSLREAWKGLKDVTGATFANVLGGRLLEKWDLISPISGRTDRFSLEKDTNTRLFGQRYIFFIHNNLLVKN